MKKLIIFFFMGLMYACNKNKIFDNESYPKNDKVFRVMVPPFEIDNCNGTDGFIQFNLSYVPSGYKLVLFYRDIYFGPCGITIIDTPECDYHDGFIGPYYPQLVDPFTSGKYFVNLGISHHNSGCTKICRQIIVGIVDPQISNPTLNDLNLQACCDFCFNISSSLPKH